MLFRATSVEIMVWATAGETPLITGRVPRSWMALLMRTSWAPVFSSMSSRPVMSMMTPRAWVLEQASSSACMIWDPRALSTWPMIGATRMRSHTSITGVESWWISCSLAALASSSAAID